MTQNEKPKQPRYIWKLILLNVAFIIYCIALSMNTDTEGPLFLRNLIIGSLVPATIGTILVVKETIERKRQSPYHTEQ